MNNILIYSSKFPPSIGGVEDVVANLAKGLSSKNNILVISSFTKTHSQKNIFKKLLLGFSVVKKNNTAGYKNYEYFMSLPRSIIGYLSFIYRFFYSLIKQYFVIKKFNPSVVNAHFLDDSLYYFYFLTVLNKFKFVIDVHGNEIHVFSKSFLYRFLFKKVLKKSSSIVVHSDFMKNEVLKLYDIDAKKIIVIPNSVDLNKFKGLRNSKNSKDYFLFVGRLDYKKGVDILIKAYLQIKDKVDLDLILIGGSSGEKKHGSISLEDLKLLSKGTDRVKFLGKQPNEVTLSYFKNAYYSVFPSRYEPFGIVALESLAVGTPFIASSGGLVEIAKKTNAGITFKTGSVTSLKNLLLRVSVNKNIRENLAVNANKNILNYSLTNFLKKYNKVLINYAK